MEAWNRMQKLNLLIVKVYTENQILDSHTLLNSKGNHSPKAFMARNAKYMLNVHRRGEVFLVICTINPLKTF